MWVCANRLVSGVNEFPGLTEHVQVRMRTDAVAGI